MHFPFRTFERANAFFCVCCLSAEDTFQGRRWIPEAADSARPCRHRVTPDTHTHAHTRAFALKGSSPRPLFSRAGLPASRLVCFGPLFSKVRAA